MRLLKVGVGPVQCSGSSWQMSPPSFCLLILLLPAPLSLQKCGLGTKQHWLPREQEAGGLEVEPSWYKPSLYQQPLFLPLVLIVDSRLQRRWGGNMTTTYRLCREVAEAVAEIVSKLGRLQVVLVEVEEWATGSDNVRIVPEADITLERFLEYREKMRDR